MSYYFHKNVHGSFDEAIGKVTEALKEQGFGVLTTINMKGKLKEKLNVDYRPYVILGACNPALAYEALKVEERIGLMLPCNVIVRETEEGTVEVAAIDPVASMQGVGKEELSAVAGQVRDKLRGVVEQL